MNLDARLFDRARGTRRPLIAAIACGTAGGVLLVAQAWLLAQAVAGLFLGGQTLSDVAPLLWAALALLGGRALATYAGGVVAARAAGRAKHALRTQLFEHLLALGPVGMAGERSGELTAALMEGVEALDAYFRQYLPRLALAALVPLAILLIVFPIDLLTGVVLLVTAPLIPVFMALIGSLAGAVSRRQWKTLGRLSAHFLDVLQGLPTLRMFGRGKDQAAGIALTSERFRAATMGVLRVAFLSALALELIGTISTAVVAVEIGVRLLYARITFEQAIFVLILAPEFYLPMRALGMSFHAATSGVAAAGRIFDLLAMRADTIPHPHQWGGAPAERAGSG